MILVSPVDAAARVRAAMAYADVEYVALERDTGIGRSTLARIAARKGRPRGATIEELWAIADACGVPRVFMEFGFEVVDEDRLRDDQDQPEMMRRLSAVEAEVRRLALRDARRGVEEHPQSDASRPQDEPPQPQQRPEEPDEPAQSDAP